MVGPPKQIPYKVLPINVLAAMVEQPIGYVAKMLAVAQPSSVVMAVTLFAKGVPTKSPTEA